MKVIVTLLDPEERHTVDVDAWARMQFERNAQKHGVPAMATRDAARHYPETYMAICTYYALRKRKQITLSFEEYEGRWGGIEGEGEPEPDPTEPTP